MHATAFETIDRKHNRTPVLVNSSCMLCFIYLYTYTRIQVYMSVFKRLAGRYLSMPWRMSNINNTIDDSQQKCEPVCVMV